MKDLNLLPSDINDKYNFLWVVDFPLFARKEEAFQDLNAGWQLCSHSLTSHLLFVY
jgi:aspartyl-tRNA synthetase